MRTDAINRFAYSELCRSLQDGERHRLPSIVMTLFKLIRRYEVTDAAVHDSQKLDELLTKGNTSPDVFGDSAYRSSAIEERLRAGGFKSRIHVRATRKRSLSERSEEHTSELQSLRHLVCR